MGRCNRTRGLSVRYRRLDHRMGGAMSAWAVIAILTIYFLFFSVLMRRNDL